jgi:hypothetical protein
MVRSLTRILALAALALPTTAVAVDVIDFEDLHPGYETYTALPAGYAGYSWNYYSWYMTKYALPGTGYEHGTVGSVSMFTAWAADVSMGGDTFDFAGAYITAAWDSNEYVTVQGYRAGAQVYSETILTHNDQAYWFDFGWSDIDTIWFRPHGNHIVIDDITFVMDEDGDGVSDDDDACLGTAEGEVVDSYGCSIDQYCPCDDGWKNHGKYVSCVAHTAEDFVDYGLITDEEKDVVVSEAGSSSCGHK